MNQTMTPSRRQTLLRSAGALATGLGLYLGTAVGVLALTHDQVLSMAVANAVIVAAVVAWRRFAPGGRQVVEHDRRPETSYRPDFWPTAAVALLVCWFAGQVTAVWLYEQLGSTGFDASVQTRQDTSPALLLITMLVLAPAGEEALMRGLVYPVLRRNWSSPIGAALVTTGIFALLHGNIVQIVLTIPLGVLLALVYERTRTLWPAISLHMVFNLLAAVVPVETITRMAQVPVILVTTMLATVVLYMLHPSRTQRPEG